MEDQQLAMSPKKTNKVGEETVVLKIQVLKSYTFKPYVEYDAEGKPWLNMLVVMGDTLYDGLSVGKLHWHDGNTGFLQTVQGFARQELDRLELGDTYYPTAENSDMTSDRCYFREVITEAGNEPQTDDWLDQYMNFILRIPLIEKKKKQRGKKNKPTGPSFGISRVLTEPRPDDAASLEEDKQTRPIKRAKTDPPHNAHENTPPECDKPQ